MQTRKLGRRAGLTLVLCGATLGGALPGGMADAVAACPVKAASPLTTGKLVAAVRSTTAPENRQINSMDLAGTNKLVIPTKFWSGNPLKPLQPDVWRPRISPDRKHVLFYTGRDDYPKEVALWSVPITGTNGATATDTPNLVIGSLDSGWPFPRHANAEFSPDGAYLVFEATAGSAFEQIYVLDICAGTASPVSAAQPLIRHRTPSFSHDQATILYSRCPSVSPCTGAHHEIYRMSVFGDAFQDDRLTDDGLSPRQDLSPVESPNAATIAFNRLQGCKAQIYSMPATGPIPRTTSVVVNDTDVNLTPSWDRNSSKLYFTWMPNKTQWKLFWVAPSGGALTPVTTGNCGEEFANLTQNSGSAVTSVTAGTALPVDRMVVSVTRTDGPTSPDDHSANEIYSMKTDGTAQTRLTTDGAATGGSWWPRLSPNRQKILFYKGGVENYQGASLWVMNWDGSSKTEIVPANGPDGVPGAPWNPPPGGAWTLQGHAEWSPDGNYIVMFGGNAASKAQLWVTSSTGTSPTRISNLANVTPPIARLDPSWSTSQAEIYYVRCPAAAVDPATGDCASNLTEVFKQSVFGDVIGTPPVSTDKQLTSDAYRDHDPYIAPNGSAVAFLRQTGCNRWGIFSIPPNPAVPVTSATVIKDDGAISSLPAWNRDSTRIYFHRLDVVNWEREAYSVNANGTGKATLSTGSHCNVEDPNATAVSG